MNFGIKEAVAVVVPYLIGVGAFFQFGYWGAFHINVLEFISLADVAKLAVYPLMASLVFLLVGVLFSEIVFSPHFPPGGGRASKVGMFGQKYWRGLLALQLCITVLVAIYWPEPVKWFLVAGLVSPFSTLFTHLEKLIEVVPNPRVRATALFLVLLLPSISFAYGRQQAFLVKTGGSKQFVDVVRSNLPIASDEKNPVAYLGFLGSVYVLRETRTGYLVFVKQREDSPLFIVSKPQ